MKLKYLLYYTSKKDIANTFILKKKLLTNMNSYLWNIMYNTVSKQVEIYLYKKLYNLLASCRSIHT